MPIYGYAGAFNRTGRNAVQSIADAISSAGRQIDEANKKRQAEQLYQTVINLFKNSNTNLQGISEGVNPNENTFSPNTTVNEGQPIPQGRNRTIGEPAPTDIMLGNFTPPGGSERYNQGQSEVEAFQNAILPKLLNPNVDPNQANKLSVFETLLQNRANKLKPPPSTWKSISPGAKLAELVNGEPTGKTITNPKENLTKNQRYERNPDGGYKLYNIGGQKYYNKITYDSGGNKIDEQLTRIPEKGEGKKTDTTDTSLKPSTATLIADLKNFKPYTVNTDGEKIPMSPEDIKFAKDKTLENIKLQMFDKLPRAYEFVNNIEELWKAGDKSGKTQYLSPKQLYDETIKHAKAGDISMKVQDAIANYLKYYSTDIYKGLLKQYKPVEQKNPNESPTPND